MEQTLNLQLSDFQPILFSLYSEELYNADGTYGDKYYSDPLQHRLLFV